MIRHDLSEQVKSLGRAMDYELSDEEILTVLNKNPWEQTGCEYGESWWCGVEDSIYLISVDTLEKDCE
tara:strand:- start:235 stop:438 length:204 start_codon:yes stop_codon:yes gene_type:complete